MIDDIISLEDVMKNAPQTKGAPLSTGASEQLSARQLLRFSAS